MKLPPTSRRFVQGAAGIAATSALTAWMMVSNDDNDEVNEESKHHIITSSSPGFKIYKSANRFVLESLLAVPKTSLDSLPTNTSGNNKVIVEYDFVILGHGNAGKCAVETLQQQCPGATIALVDPLRPPTGQQPQNKLHYYSQPALGFHPRTRTVELSAGDGSTDNTRLKYRHAILVATGSRGAPPPMELLDRPIWNRILELRPTEMSGSTKRPVLPPETIRQLSIMASTQGANVCVLGSGWEALELAIATAANSSNTESSPSAMIAFGSAGPLSHLLPRYLSTAVTKRLRQHGIDVHERALVRYVSHHQVRGARKEEQYGASRMEVHTAKSFDLLDTQRNLVDLLVVAPSVNGSRGTAVLPMLNVPDSLEEHSLGRTWYQSWSQLSSPPSEPSTVVCFADDGRISVNAELNAASKVYAAGSAAKYPNSMSGHAHVAGEGSVDGALAGRLAALHMARDYQERNRSILQSHNDASDIEPASFASKSLPIFRSDISPYNLEDGHRSSLAKVGIKALVVGHCDSEKMSTHGFWWTNVADKRHQEVGLTRRKRTKKMNGSSSSPSHPIYGSGIVFYLDRSGRIRGVMSWGLPITAPSKAAADGSEEELLNPKLVNRMKEIIGTNGGITRASSDPLLNTAHLTEESKNLAQMALSTVTNNGSSRRRRLTAKINRISKPLHRYTAAKPPSISSIGLLKRKDQSSFSELLGENIYIRDDDRYNEADRVRPPSLLYIYPMHRPSWRHGMGGDDEENKWKNPYLSSQEDLLDEAWKENERRARPPKEEPLWLRRGDAMRNVSMQDVMNDTFLSNMRSGRFADGSEPFQRAKVPSAVQEASEKLRTLVGGVARRSTNNNEDDDGYADEDDEDEN